MTSSRQLVFSGNLPWFMRAVAILLIPVNLMAVVSPTIVVAAISPIPPVRPAGGSQLSILDAQLPLLQPPSSAFAQQPASVVPHSPSIPKFAPPSADSQLSTFNLQLHDPTDRELITARCFGTPLVPLPGEPLPNENLDLAKALLSFHGAPQDVSPLTAFLAQHPDSRWKASLLADLGRLYCDQGYWSKSLAAFEEAWTLSKNATDPRLKTRADFVFGELVQLHSRFGHADRLEALLNEANGRDIQGAGTQRVIDAREELGLMKKDPAEAFRCGPLAVGLIFQILRPNADNTGPHTIHELKSTAQGTDLATLASLMKHVDLDYQVAFRAPGAPVPVPSIIHWKIGHYATLTKKVGDKYLSQDRTIGVNTLVSSAVLDAEASGYFLIPTGALPAGWRAVGVDEAKTVFGKGNSGPPGPNPPPCDSVTADQCQPCAGGQGSPPMTGYNLDLASVSLMLSDTPVGYAPPVGLAVYFTANYNHREEADMTSVSNLGNKWSFNLLSYIEPSSTSAIIFGPGGGQLPYTGYDSGTGYFSVQQLSQDLLQQISPASYIIYHKDGSKEIYDLPDGSATPRIFRTKRIDAQGNAVTYGYDSNYRLVTVMDALNQTMVLSYGNSSDPANPAFYNITKVTDPFGRFATFGYNGSGQLTSITDILGLTSQFTYGTGDFITSLTTPYGTTQFAGSDIQSGGSVTDRWLQATDPIGGQERVEWVADASTLSNNPIAIPGGYGSEPVAPAGFTNDYLNYRNTFYWNKKAMATAPGDYTKAKIFHWLHSVSAPPVGSYILESTKAPLENRVWYAYAGQPNTTFPGTINKPSRTARILDDGTEQDYQYQYNASGNVTQSTDPLGRETDYVYDTNNIDLLQVKQKNGSGYDILSSFTYNLQHLPLTATDASGQTTTYTYNPPGRPLTVTNAKNEITSFAYDPNGYLLTITFPPSAPGLSPAVTTLTYDGFGRVHTVTDSESYTVTTDYDVFDRPTRVTYPDGTFAQVLYNRLDAEWTQDRLGRWTHQLHDANRHLIVLEDPLFRKTSYDWCTCGALAGITDPAGKTTTWIRDVQSRVTSKIYPGGTSLNYAYENTTSRLKSVTDARSQRTNQAYNKDNTLAQITYTDTSGNPLVPATPTVSYTYDPNYLRIASMADGIGATNYTYNPVVAGTLGSGFLSSMTGPLPNSTIAYTYDELGRVVNEAHSGPVSGTLTTVNLSSVYDPLGRIASVTNPLGAFGYTYVNQTGRVAQIAYPNGQVTNYSYYPNSAATPGNDDQRLAQIQNLKPDASGLSTFGYGYNTIGLITSWSKQIDASSALTGSFTYDGADQLISASVPLASGPTPQAYQYQYDLAGNRTTEQIDLAVTGSTYNNLNQLLSSAGTGNMVFSGTVSTLNNPVALTLAGQPATVDATGNWSGTAPVQAGANAIPLVATDANGQTTTKTINITVTDSGVNHTLTYDANGNLTNDGAGKTYGYDAANRLISITQASGVTGFAYDGLGHRVQETANGAVVKQWVWCGGVQPCEERDSSGNVTKRFYDQGEQINGASFFFTYDHLGSVREMTDNTGTIRVRYDYDPYGRQTKLSGDLDADFGFCGYYRDQATEGDWLAENRILKPDIGRWLTRDPIGEAGGTNLYLYVGGNPINENDPWGLSGRLTIYSAGTSGIGIHSWISYTPDGGATTYYGTYGNHPTDPKTGQPLPNGLEVNYDAGRTSADAMRSAHLNDDQEKILYHIIGQYKTEGESAWKYGTPCSSFAANAWDGSTGEHLSPYGWLISNPASLTQAIIKANGGVPNGTATLGTGSSSYPGSVSQSSHTGSGSSSISPAGASLHSSGSL